MNLTKDSYEYLLNFADDKDILNMLSVNKKFRDEEFFEKILKRKYPDTLQYKGDYESYRSFFIKTIYYLSKLKEKYDIPYFVGMDPENLYKASKNLYLSELYNKTLLLSSRYGNLDVVNLMMKKGANDIISAADFAAKGGHLNVIKYFIDKGARNFSEIATSAAYYAHGYIIDYLLEKKYIDKTVLNQSLYYATLGGHLSLIKHLISLGADDFKRIFQTATTDENQEIIDYIKQFL